MSLPVLWEPWCQAVLRFGTGELELDLRDPSPDVSGAGLEELGLAGPFAVITPCNPHGTVLDAEANASRLAAANDDLSRRDLRRVPTVGRSPDGHHAEPGWALVITKPEALALSRDWEQAGFYWWDGTRFWIVPTDPDAGEVALPVGSS